MIRNYKDFHNEPENLAYPNWMKDLEKVGKLKMLPLKYVLMFDDDEINENFRVYYSTNSEKFQIIVNGTFFNGKTVTVDSYHEMLSYIKLYMISLKTGDAEIVDELRYVIDSTPFEKMAEKFYDRILKSEMKISDEALELLGITKTIRNAKKFGI